jgi:phosphoglycolate phosphatase-like HAD superfamily hydrolase
VDGLDEVDGLAMATANPVIVALDFDGVICDSARETAVSAWRAGRGLWPEWAAEAPPPEYVARFLRLRPWLETGYQAIVMMRMIADGLPEAEFVERLEEHCRACLARLGCSRDDLVKRFGRTRDEWIGSDFAGWIASHDFYPGVIETLSRERAHLDVYVLTTKQERFARALLESRGLRLPPERLFGFDRGRAKEDILAGLVGGPERPAVHFVEDRAETLRRVLAVPTLAAVRLYYAAWGYGTVADLAWARAERRVRVWGLAEFLELGDS